MSPKRGGNSLTSMHPMSQVHHEHHYGSIMLNFQSHNHKCKYQYKSLLIRIHHIKAIAMSNLWTLCGLNSFGSSHELPWSFVGIIGIWTHFQPKDIPILSHQLVFRKSQPTSLEIEIFDNWLNCQTTTTYKPRSSWNKIHLELLNR